MRIAVDARPLAPPVTGIGIYARSLLERMLGSGHSWLLYSDRPLEISPLLDHPQIEVRHGRAAGQSLYSLYLANRHFLRWASADRAQLFWSPRHHLPFLLPNSLPAVVTVHDLVWRRYPDTMPWKNRQLERAAMASSLRKARRIIAVSEFTARELAHFYPEAAARTRVVLEAGRALGDPETIDYDFPFFLFVGTQEPRKNTYRLLRAFRDFVQSGAGPNRLVFAGAPGWGEVSVESASQALGIGDRVIVEGYASDARLAGLYDAAEALVLPSLYEGFGLPVVESMSAGTPVVASDRAALPEVMGTGGLLVDPESEASIAAALQQIAGDGAMRERLASQALAQAATFSWDRAAEETLAVLESATDLQP